MASKFSSTIIFVGLIVFSGLAFANSPTSTECTNNHGSAGCQNPVFTDDKDEYFFDLRASSDYNGGVPSKNSITLLHGGEAGNGSSGNLINSESDSVSTNQKTEYYIQGDGKAGENGFGRGSLESEDVSVNDGLEGSDSLGEYIVNPPHLNSGNGMCGDGYKSTTDDSVSCPQEHNPTAIMLL